MADLDGADEEDYLLSLMDEYPPLRGKNLPAPSAPLAPMMPERNPAFHDVPDTVSEQDSLLQMLDRDPAANVAALSWGGQPSRPEPGGVPYGLASLAPVAGNAIAARDTYHAFDHLKEASKSGDIREQRKAALAMGMSFLSAISPFHFSGAASRAAEGASSRTNIFAGPMAKTADKDALERAYKLKEVGADRDHIWEETGWDVHRPDGPARWKPAMWSGERASRPSSAAR